MTNIEKLYELAGIKEKHGVELTVDPTSEELKFNEHYVCYGYPPFTDTKQLELIKKLARIQPIKITDTSENWFVEPSGYYQMTPSKDFPQALVGLVCELWEDLTDEQREEIKRILE